MSSNAAAQHQAPGPLGALRTENARLEKVLGRRPKLLACEIGDGAPSSGVEALALAARNAGFDVVYEGLTAAPAQLITSAIEEGVHVIGVVAGTQGPSPQAVAELVQRAVAGGLSSVPVVVVGDVPSIAAQGLVQLGVAAVRPARDSGLAALLSQLAGACG